MNTRILTLKQATTSAENAQHIDLIDKAQARDFVLIEGDGLLEIVMNEFTDTTHGGQILQMVYTLERFLVRLNNLQMNYEFVFFNQGDYCEAEKPQKDTNDTQQPEENTEGCKTIFMQPKKRSNLQSLVMQVLLQHLKQLKFTCHHFDTWYQSDDWESFLEQKTPAFIVIASDSMLLHSYHVFECGLQVVHSLDFRANGLYGFLSVANRAHEARQRNLKYIEEFVHNNALHVHEITPIECTIHGSDDQSRLLSLISQACARIVTQDKSFAPQAVALILTTVTTFDAPLALRAQSLSENYPLSTFINLIQEQLCSIITYNDGKVPPLIDVFDGRLFYKIWFLLCQRKPTSLTRWVNKERYNEFHACISLFDGSEDFSSAPDVNNTPSEPSPTNNTLYKLHPIDNEFVNDSFVDESIEYYDSEESKKIITENVLTEKNKHYMDNTHWKSSRLLEDDVQTGSQVMSEIQRLSLSRYGKGMNKSERVFLNQEAAIKHGTIDEEFINAGKQAIERENVTFGDLLAIIDKLLDKWVSNFRRQSLQVNNDHREALLLLVAEAVILSTSKIPEHISSQESDSERNCRILLFCKAAFDVFRRAYDASDPVYQVLQQRSFLERLVENFSKYQATTHLAKKICEMFDINYVSLIELPTWNYKRDQFVESLIPDFVSRVYPRHYALQDSAHNIWSLLLHYTKNEWRQTIDHIVLDELFITFLTNKEVVGSIF
jgi:hypothetical protein